MSMRGNPRGRGTGNNHRSDGAGSVRGAPRGAGGGRGWGTGDRGARGSGPPTLRFPAPGGAGGAGRGAGRGAGSFGGQARGGMERGGGGGGGGERGERGGERGRESEKEPLLPFAHGQPIPAIDYEVTTLENQIVPQESRTKTQTVPSGGLAKVSPKSINKDCLPMRPGFGELGREVVLRTNYYKLELKGDQPLYRYSVTICKRGKQDPEEMSKRRKRSILEVVLQEPEFRPLNNVYATDWASMIITTVKVTLTDGPPKNRKIFNITDGHTPTDEFSVEVEQTLMFHLQSLLDYVLKPSQHSLYDDKDDVIQALNIITSKVPDGTANVALIGRSKYFPLKGHDLYGDNHKDLGAAVEAIRGFYTSVRIATGRVLVNVNVATTAVYKALPLPELMREFCKVEKNNKDLENHLERFLRGLRVETNHVKGKDGKPRVRVDVICGLARRPKDHSPGDSSEIKFPIDKELNGKDRNRQITVKTILRESTAFEIQMMELKTPLAGQPVRRMLLLEQQRKMIDFACLPCPENAEAIQSRGLRVMGFNSPANSLEDFGVQVGREMLIVPGRILGSPDVHYDGETFKVEDGHWNIKKRKFIDPKPVTGWACLIINEMIINKSNGNKQDLLCDFDAEYFTRAIQETFSRYGVIVHAPHQSYQNGHSIKVDLGSENDVNKRLGEAFDGFWANKVEFVFILLPRKHTYLYTRIKNLADVNNGIHTVNMVQSKLHRKGAIDDQYLANIALKMNLKRGGVNHKIDRLELAPLDHQTMIVGLDVTHPSPGSSENAPSIAAVVASRDLLLAQWPASIRLQSGKKEMVGRIDNQILKEMLQERLKCWRGWNKGALPNKLLIYRDGVSEGQYNSVLDQELPQIREACKVLYSEANLKRPKVTMIVVGKRHHTRFYPTTVEDSDQTGKFPTGNPKNGTVVDRGITMAKHWDFFLQAHKGLKGTARPAHYFVIKDGIGFGKDNIQTLTHNLCYVFGRSTSAVSICPPAYYADKVCDHARLYFHELYRGDASTTTGGSSGANQSIPSFGGVHERLRNSMFYI